MTTTTNSNSTPITNAYAKKLFINSIPGKATKSVEYYFGDSNPLKDGLLGWINHLRERIDDYKTLHPEATPFEMLGICKESSDQLKRIIITNFNVEKVFISWENNINAACFSISGNRDIYGTSKEAKEIKLNADSIIDVKKGFRYKNSKGLIYLIRLGFPIFAQKELFSPEEAAAVLVHELGHAMQHMINDLYQTESIGFFQTYYEILGKYIDQLSVEEMAECGAILEYYEKIKDDPKALRKFGEELYNGDAPKYAISYKNMDDDKLFAFTGVGDNNWEVDAIADTKSMVEARNAKYNSFANKLGRFIRGIITIPIAPFYYIGCKLVAHNDKKDELGKRFKYFEETADNFCHIYGLGVASASMQKKFNELSVRPKSGYENIPIFNFYYSYKALMDDRLDSLAGYPTHKQRMMNMYRACMYELKNNKDLSDADKKSLEKDIEDYKKFYDYFVYSDSRKGKLYRSLSGISRKGIEAAGKQDTNVIKNVLEPLNERMKKNKDFDTNKTTKIA